MTSITVHIPYIDRFSMINQILDRLLELSDNELQDTYDQFAIGNARLLSGIDADINAFDERRATFVVQRGAPAAL